jgi:hypothetical protein
MAQGKGFDISGSVDVDLTGFMGFMTDNGLPRASLTVRK